MKDWDTGFVFNDDFDDFMKVFINDGKK